MSDLPASPAQRIAIVIVAHQGQYLVGQRPAGVPLAGYWEFPGGKVHADETPADAALRECREETGLDVQITAAEPPLRHAYAHGLLEIYFFHAALRSIAAVPRAPFGWVDRSSLGTLRFPPANREIIARLTASETP